MPADQTLQLQVNVRHITPEDAESIRHAVAEAVASIVGHAPNMTSELTPDYTGPARSPEATARAHAEGRR